MRFRWYITKRHLVILLGTFVAIVFWLLLTSCIPVTVRPQFDDKGLPIALPVTPTGSVSPDGTLNPVYPISAESPKPFNWSSVGVGLSIILNALLAAYGINLRGFASKAMTALRITADLADANARAETDSEVEKNKLIAAHQQVQAGVHKITQKARGKA